MNNSGDAAEQVVRMSLEGIELALKISGSAAKNVAAALYVVLKDQKKTKGKARVVSMLKEKRPTTIYTLKKEDCPKFAQESKRYGILYAPIPVNKGDDTIDVMVFSDDAARANRIVEKFKLSAVNTATIRSEVEKSREERSTEPAAPEKATPEKGDADKLLDELMGAPLQKEKQQPEHPAAEQAAPFGSATEKSPPSEPISENSKNSARGTSNAAPEKPSVRKELREIQRQRMKETEAPAQEAPAAEKKPAQKTTRHQQPPKARKKPKTRER